MKRDSRLSRVLHVLLHMIEHGEAMTSAALARYMNTNPVVVRRTMAGLREAGFLRSEKGHGGGWSIACDPAAVTLADIHRALGEPALVALGHGTDQPDCLVEQVVNAALDEAFNDAEAVLVARFGDITLAALAADFHRRLPARHKRGEHHEH